MGVGGLDILKPVDPYSHLASTTEITEAIVEGRDTVALCGATGDGVTKEGEFVFSKPLCPICERLSKENVG